jgi:hypothetical protein
LLGGALALIENSQIELALAPGPSRSFPVSTAAAAPTQLERIYTNIADVKERTFEIGVLAGGYRAMNYTMARSSIPDDRVRSSVWT